MKLFRSARKAMHHTEGNAPHCVKPPRGFTMIEVLITMAVLSMVLLTGAFAYNYMAQNWQRNQAAYNQAYADYVDWTNVQRAVTNTMPKLVTNGSQLGFYFLGRDNGFTAVTQVAVQDPDFPAVYRLFREQDQENGGWQLVYEEALLRETLLTSSEQSLPFNFRLELVRGQEDIAFEYYGWENLDSRMRETGEYGAANVFHEWYEEYDGMERQQHPVVIQTHIGDFLWPVMITDITDELLSRGMDQDI